MLEKLKKIYKEKMFKRIKYQFNSSKVLISNIFESKKYSIQDLKLISSNEIIKNSQVRVRFAPSPTGIIIFPLI